MLADPAALGNLEAHAAETLFDPEFWRGRGELSDAARGRGAAWFIASGGRRWVLRHYRRGGFIARFSRDAYVWTGEDAVRAFAEWRLLDELVERGLPVPRPVAAHYRRSGPWYRCDLITQRIADAEPLSARLATGLPLPESWWRAVGAAIARLHGAGADHADLNAHNILLDARGTVSIIDFDRGRLRAPGAWRAGNLRRLRRSLDKISGAGTRSMAGGYSPAAWQWLLAGYRDAA